MAGNELQIGEVSDTSFWVAHYRVLESERPHPLFNDPYAKRLAGARGRKMADSMGIIGMYAEWSVVSRTVIIDRFILKMIAEGVDAVINLGAGLDARPFRLDLPADLLWVEVDYPKILEHKAEVLKGEVPRCRLSRVGLDLANAPARREFLESVVPQARKVLILTEGVITYLSQPQVAELASDLFAQPRFAYWIVEYFDPRAYKYVQSNKRMKKMKNAPFQFFPPDWFGFFKTHGWCLQETHYTGDIALEFKRMPPMPWWSKLILPWLGKKTKEAALRMTGYSILKRC